VRYLNFIILGISFFFSGCSSTFSGNTTEHSEAKKLSANSDTPAKVRPYAYSGTLKLYDAPFWRWPFSHPDYGYCITDEKGTMAAFLDISDLAMGTSLVNFIDKTVTISGQIAPHKHHGAIVINARYITDMTSF
jgi:hypothetical protein